VSGPISCEAADGGGQTLSWNIDPDAVRRRVAYVEAKVRVRTRVHVHGTTRTTNAKMKDEDELAHHHCHYRRYQRHRWYGTSHELKIGLTGPGRQKADLGTASPFLPLLGRSSGMGEAWRTSAPSSAGAVACVCVGQIAL